MGSVVWTHHRETGALAMFPPVGQALAALPHPRATVADAALRAITDDNYSWM